MPQKKGEKSQKSFPNVLPDIKVDFSSLYHSLILVLFIFTFCKAEHFYASATESLRQRGKNETKLHKIRHEMHEKRCEFS